MTSESPWHQQAALFRRLYIDENKTLKQVKSEAEGVYGFPSNSLSAYETKLRGLLGLRKNLTPEGWLAISQRLGGNEDRTWDVYIHGRKVPRRKVMKEIGRYAKHALSSKNLPMPSEVQIKWTDLSLSRVAAKSTRGQIPQQVKLPILSDSIAPFASDTIGTGYEDCEMVEYHLTVSVTSPCIVLQDMPFLVYNQPGIIEETIEIALATTFGFPVQFCAAILVPRLRELWEPRLNNLPVISLIQALDQILHELFAQHISTGFLPISQIVPPRHVGTARPLRLSHKTNLGQFSYVDDRVDHVGHVPGLPTKGTVSTGFDPLHILGQLIYYLSNHFEGLKDVEETMSHLMREAPLNLISEFLRAESPAIKESWIRFADWSFELGEKDLFEHIMRVFLSCAGWLELHGARCLALAANLGCTKVVNDIIECGVSPNEFSEFTVDSKHSGENPGFSRLAALEFDRVKYPDTMLRHVKTCPLVEAALRSRLDILKILKDAQADCQLRLGDLTASGYVVCAYQCGLIDLDDLSLTLPFLLSMGENVDAPMCQSEHIYDSYKERSASWSDETLLDAIYIIIGNTSLFKKVQERSQTPHGVLTVSGILQSAEAGKDSLHHYMVTASYPSGLPRKRIEDIAIVRGLQHPNAFKAMIETGFSLERKTLQRGYHPYFRDWYAGDLLHDDPDDDIQCYDNYFLRRLNSFPPPVSEHIVDLLAEAELSFGVRHMKSSTIQALVPKLSANLIQNFGVDLFWKAMESGDSDATEACLKAIGSPQEIDVLKFQKCRVTDGEILKVLHDYGTRVAPFQQDSKTLRLEEFSTTMLQWLMANLSQINKRDTHDIVFQFLLNEVDWIDPAAFEQWVTNYKEHSVRYYYRSPFDSEQAETYKESTHAFFALHVCLEGSMSAILELSLDEGLDLNSQQVISPKRKGPKIHDSEAASELEHAVRDCNISMVQTLLDRGDDINYCDGEGHTALEIAVRSYVNASTINRRIDWEYEAAIVSKQIVINLLERGADPNVQRYKFSRTTDSPLALVVDSDYPDLQLIQLLLEKGACVDINSQRHGDPLLSSMLKDKRYDLQLRKEMLALFLAHGAKYDKYDELCTSSRFGDIELVRFHLDNGADPNQPKQESWRDSPLEMSASAGNISLAMILLAAGATFSGEDHSLSKAAAKGRLDMVSLILEHEKRLEEVERALECALKGRFYSIIQRLKQAQTNWEV